jgi:hypothetical protein
MTVWREKFIAMAIHFAATLALAALAAALIFFVWFPHPFELLIGGLELFLLVVGCDLVLGPLMSLVLYDSRKTRLALTVDYTLVAILQLSALIYGVAIVSGTRPVYVAFNGDRYEVVAAWDIRDKELALAPNPEYRSLPWTGPRLVAVHVPKEDQQDALFESLDGNEEHQRPKFFVEFEAKADLIRSKVKPLAELEKRKPESKPLLDEAVAGLGIPAEELGWLPARHLKGFSAVIVRKDEGRPLAWADFDPYD